MASIQGILAFGMTARHSSFARAARELGLTPSSLAKSVARLEQQLGLRLFHHPGLTFDLRLSDQRVDLIGSTFDAAIRISPLEDSRLVARTIDTQQVLTCASPEYVRTQGRP